jgi:pyruvate/oxaloacetate carboxyltransferase
MKIFLIAAGLLMTGASVYGVVDYNKKTESGALKELYKEKPAPVDTEIVEEVSKPVIENKETPKVEEVVVTEKKTTRKMAKKKKEERVFRMKEFSRAQLK